MAERRIVPVLPLRQAVLLPNSPQSSRCLAPPSDAAKPGGSADSPQSAPHSARQQ